MEEFNPTDYITREEQYLANMAGGSNDVPDPITRKEKYLKAIADRMDGAAAKGLPSGGTTGQALVKKTGADFDAEWNTIETSENVHFVTFYSTVSNGNPVYHCDHTYDELGALFEKLRNRELNVICIYDGGDSAIIAGLERSYKGYWVYGASFIRSNFYQTHTNTLQRNRLVVDRDGSVAQSYDFYSIGLEEYIGFASISSNLFYCSHTYAQILEAYNNGRVLIGYFMDGNTYKYMSGLMRFQHPTNAFKAISQIVNTSNDTLTVQEFIINDEDQKTYNKKVYDLSLPSASGVSF